jgi:hypothetical protein
MVLASLMLTGVVHAQDLTAVVADGSYRVLGGDTVSNATVLPKGFEPVNQNVAYVYDPNFHFYMRGYNVDPAFDRRAEFQSYGYVVVDAAGDPGGNYRTAPSWITHTGFSATTDMSRVTVTFSYDATYVPVMRGYQSYIIYANLKRTPAATHLYVYDEKLVFGQGNYLLTGDGPEALATLDMGSPDATQGTRAIQVQTTGNTGGTHWKLMLFANGNAAAYKGTDLRPYTKLVFYAKASRNVVLQGGFGTGDDTGFAPFAPMQLTTQYKRFEVDISKLDRSDINTPFWVYLHKSLNPVDFTNLSVFIDGVELLTNAASSDATIVVDSGNDSLDGSCARDGKRTGRCNLRAALDLASQVTGRANIRVEVDQNVSLGQMLVSANSESVSITGVAGKKALKGTAPGRLFYIEPNAALTLSSLSVQNFDYFNGGALVNDGDLTLDGVRVSDNSVRCFGIGAGSSFATCYAGALDTHGTLKMRGGSSFERNVVVASASTASNPVATASGGAIANSGDLTIDGEVLFADNAADASATAGYHNGAPSSASASATGGAIWHTHGRLAVIGGGVHHCTFRNNSTLATAFTATGSVGSQASAGGAISSLAELSIPDGACTFSNNSADLDPDIHQQF